MDLLINKKNYSVDIPPSTSLLTCLRDHLELTGSKYGCGEGQCGACTVLIDGYPSRSCITPVGGVQGREITTIEGLEQEGELHAIQKAALEVDVFQCAYCASGMMVSAAALLKQNPAPNENEIKSFMNGNICRCGTYPRIVKAIQQAATQKG